MILGFIFKATGRRQHAAEIDEAVNAADFICANMKDRIWWRVEVRCELAIHLCLTGVDDKPKTAVSIYHSGKCTLKTLLRVGWNRYIINILEIIKGG